MTDSALLKMSIAELAPRVKARQVSPVELVDAALARAEELQPVLRSFITLLPQEARAQAKVREQAIVRGEHLGPLDGIPIGIKDNIATAAIRTTLGSRVFADNVPSKDAYVVHLCKQAGAIILGKENMHEFAAGGTSNNPYYGAVRNPWNLDCVPGGSSGGSAANVAAGVTFASLGTDVAGSVRLPASYCGLVGMKATYGRVSQRGLLGTHFNGDHIGPLTRTARDNALVLQVISGADPLDPTTVPVSVPDYLADIGRGLEGLKIGVPANYYFDVVDPAVEAAVRRAIASLRDLGAEVREVRLDTLQYADLLRIAFLAEGFVAQEPYLAEHGDEYSPALFARYAAGGFVLARDYIKTLKLQRLVCEDFAQAFQQVDVLVTPTNPTPAPTVGQQTVTINGVEHQFARPGIGTIGIRDTLPSNATGLPSVSVPCGLTPAGLPVGLQLIGRPFEEGLLYRVASAYEMASPQRGIWPPIAAS